MAVSTLGRSIKRPPFGFCSKISLAVLLGISFVVVWSTFSSPSSSVSSQRSSFDNIEIDEVVKKKNGFVPHTNASHSGGSSVPVKERVEENGEEEEKKAGVMNADEESGKGSEGELQRVAEKQEGSGENDKGEVKEEIEVVGDVEGGSDGDPEGGGGAVEGEEEVVAEERSDGKSGKGKKKLGPLFDPKARYSWKLCSGRSGYNYIPCVDLEGAGSGKLQSHRHHERSCPSAPPLCLTPLPQGYGGPIPWPESQSKIFYRNVAHPKLSAFIKSQSWLKLSGDCLTFPGNESVYRGGAAHYLDFIVEMVPDIDWGKNIRIILDIGCTDASFSIALLEKEVLTLSLGMMNEQTDLAQLSLERGIPAVVGSLGTRKLPFPSGVFDAIHCGECNIPWHSNGGKILLEMNRILRPGGYFLLLFGHRDIEDEAMSKLTSAICWNIISHKTDDETDLAVKIYQRPSSNDVYELRGRRDPPLCKEEENQDAAWYMHINTCLHKIPAAIEQRGTDWPEEWPKRLEEFPEWLADSQEKLMADTAHWKAIFDKSYLNGMGIDWTHVRNVMDMKAIYGGFAAALASQKVWVMNVVPVNAPNTLPIIYERGLLGIYHDWCESFSTYPRSYDLLHADHLFSRLKNRCKQPVSIVVEMDRILRPGGWAIIRDKLEILNPLEAILRTMHWEIRMTYTQDKQGIICVQKMSWRP